MNTKGLPEIPMTSALELMRHFSDDESLPTSEDEAMAVLMNAPEQLRGRTLVFPRVVYPGKTVGRGIQQSACILAADWDEERKLWRRYQLIAGPNAGFANVRVPEHVKVSSMIPERV